MPADCRRPHQETNPTFWEKNHAFALSNTCEHVAFLAGGRPRFDHPNHDGQCGLAEEFQPIKEAEMPKDFPGYTPVGQIEVKQYPAYRKASASGLVGILDAV